MTKLIRKFFAPSTAKALKGFQKATAQLRRVAELEDAEGACQSARNVDPLSASNLHPPVDDERLACPALAGVAEGRPSAGDGYLRL